LVVREVKQRLVGLLFVTQPTNVAVKVLIMVVTLEWVITVVTGVDLHSATVIISGLVPLMHHSLQVDLEQLKLWLTAGFVVDAGMYLTEQVDRVV
jgi:hypothetical protein